MTYGEAYFCPVSVQHSDHPVQLSGDEHRKAHRHPGKRLHADHHPVRVPGENRSGGIFLHWILRMLRSRNGRYPVCPAVHHQSAHVHVRFACYTTTILMLPFLTGQSAAVFHHVKEKAAETRSSTLFLLGVAFILGTKIRANLLITLDHFCRLSHHSCAQCRYLWRRKETGGIPAAGYPHPGGGLCYSACMSAEHKYVKGITPIPSCRRPINFLFFLPSWTAWAPTTRRDHVFIQGFGNRGGEK